MVYEQHDQDGRKTFHVIQLGAKARRWTDRDPHLCITGRPVGPSKEAGG